MADNRPIGVFDSGLGGLTVLSEISKILPNENIVYFGDVGRVPYGNKSVDIIKLYANQAEKFLLTHDVKYIVAACGTVSSVAEPNADDLPVPFMGVVKTAVREAVETTKSGKIGVIGTEATITNGAHKREILKLLPEAKVYEKACPLFVPLVEEGIFSLTDRIAVETAERYLLKMVEEGIDTLILGCTHYPLLSDVIRQVVGENVRLVNMGVSTAATLKAELEKNDMLRISEEKPYQNFFASDKTAAFSRVAKILLGKELCDKDLTVVDVSKK